MHRSAKKEKWYCIYGLKLSLARPQIYTIDQPPYHFQSISLSELWINKRSVKTFEKRSQSAASLHWLYSAGAEFVFMGD